MAGFGDLLQRISRSLEEASAQQPGDDLRARLGYGTGDDDEENLEPDAAWERETEAEAESAWRAESDREPESIWAPAPSRAPERATAALRVPEAPRTVRPWAGTGSRTRTPTAPSTSRTAPAVPLPERIRARLHSPDVLRESFVVKEILDRPLGRRRRK